MKKFISLLIAMLLVTGSYAAKKSTSEIAQSSKDVKEAIVATHQDVKDIVVTTHEDVVGAVSTVYEDGKGLISTIYGDSKELAENLYPEVKSAVIAIAKAIGVAAEHLYSVLVKKYVVEGLVQLIPFLVGLALLIVGWIKLEKYIKTHDKIQWHILYPGLLAGAGIVFLCLVDYNTMFMGLINPEFGAINYILDFTKEMIK